MKDGVITRLTPKRSRSDRVTVHLGGSAAFDVAAGLVDRAALHVGDALTMEDQKRLLEADAPYRAREKALALLAVRERSRHEIELRLQRAGFEPGVVADTLGWLEGLDYLDDRRFVERYVSEKLANGWGERRVRAELLRRGVERRVVDEGVGALTEKGAGAQDLEMVTALARRRFGRQFAVDPETGKRRLAGFMARRGYDWDAIRTVTGVLASEAGIGAWDEDPECDSQGSGPTPTGPQLP